MSEKGEVKMEALPDLDDLLQCPVCYEIPSGQIFQCNEGHHVCGRCKLRLDVCPVCRALFFGTRNYAMEELIANVRKLRAFKLGGKVTAGSTSESSTPAHDEATPEADEESSDDEEDNNLNFASRPAFRIPQACKGLFRCLCCKTGNAQRLPMARLLNHLRYFHSPELIEGKSENGEYLQAWQFPTVPGRLVTAVRIADMGIFFLVIEINDDAVYAWLSMASAPWVAHEFCYTFTICGNDREAIFSDVVWSVRSCEGSLKKRGHSLVVNGCDARSLLAATSISSKLSVKRVPIGQLTTQAPPRTVLRVANRVTTRDAAQEPEPRWLQELQSNVDRLSRAFASLGREADALVRSEAEMRARIDVGLGSVLNQESAPASRSAVAPPPPESPPSGAPVPPPVVPAGLSRNARRRMRQRLRVMLNIGQPEVTEPRPTQPQPTCPAPPQPRRGPVQRFPTPTLDCPRPRPGMSQPPRPAPPPVRRPQPEHVVFSGVAVLQPSSDFSGVAVLQQTSDFSGGPSNEQRNGNSSRANKKKRRQRR